ncbi:pre-tRNA nuclear export protein [Mycoemilia scoparia]|uniref:Exportin-T n=1 Tax=Mycoemilia scoparia TaxID=417184 RepID=A0A9W8DTD1_9FUNG|nr:pre-tRNA nuclear export protein [Mycoemilia scoparia]
MDQFEEAVRYALDPSVDANIKSQAIQYCESVKNSQDGWKVCLELFVQGSTARSPESRLYSLQVIDSSLVHNSQNNLSLEDIGILKKILFEFVEQRYGTEYYDREPLFILKKLAHTLTLLFLQAYPEKWQSFFVDFAKISGLNKSSITSSPPQNKINARLTDFFLKILSSIDEEVVNPVVPRSKTEIDRNTNIKDAMRVSDTDLLAAAWHTILSVVSNGSDSFGSITPSLQSEIANETLRLIGVYSSWISITLIVNDYFKPLIFKFFAADDFASEAIRCVVRIISKGMQPNEKLELVRYLGVSNVINQYSNGYGDGDFRKDLATLVATLGNELVDVSEKVRQKSSQELWNAAYSGAENMVYVGLRLVAKNEDQEATLVMLPFINNFISVYKKLATEQQEQLLRLERRRAVLNQILRDSIKKLEYAEDQDFSDYEDPNHSLDDASGGDYGGDNDETFFSLRHDLRTVLDAIASIDFDLFEETIIKIIKPTLASIGQYGVSDTNGHSEQPVGWVKAELALTLVRIYSDWLVSARPTNLPKKLTAPSVNRTQSILANTRLPEIMRYMIESNISTSQHPAISPLLFEICVRQSYFYSKDEIQYIKPVLMAFVGPTGIRSRYGAVRTRTWYLFYRFLKQVDYTPFATDLVEGVKDLLTIQAEIPGAGAEGYGVFDSQLYLFEAMGMAISAQTLDEVKRAQYLDQVFNPLISQATELVSSNVVANNQQALLQVHHIISATGSLAKGFPDAKVDPKSITPPDSSHVSESGKAALKKVTELIIAILRSLHQFSVIREAVRFSFSRLLTVLGSDAFDYVPNFIDAIFPSCTAEEWKDILTFLGLVAYKFKAHAAPIISSVLLRVSESVFVLIKSIDPQQGTDDALLQIELKSSYLNWIISIFSSSMDPVFWTGQNESGWPIIFKQISEWALPPGDSITAVNSSNGLSPEQQNNNTNAQSLKNGTTASATGFFRPEITKLVISALHRLVDSWLRSELTKDDEARLNVAKVLNIDINPQTNGNKIQVNTIEFFETTILPLVFHICLSKKLNFKDAQASLIMIEVARLLQASLKWGGAAWFESKILQTYLPQAGCPPKSIMEFGQAVSTLNDKQLKTFMVRFFA